MSLAKAIAAFIANGCDRTRMNVPAWAATYRAELEAVRSEWDRQMTTKSLGTPDNQYDSEGK